MKKRSISLLLALALTLALFGCATASAHSVDLMEGIKALPMEPEAGISAKVTAAVAQFGLELFLSSAEGEKNPLISPLSVITALAMTANGARGETLAQMESAFGMDLYTLNRALGQVMSDLPAGKTDRLSLANAIWFKDTPSFAPEQSFLQTNANYYGAGLYKAPFDSTTLMDINRWVEEHTDGMVKDILDQIPEEAVMYLVNALAFEGEWLDVYTKNQVRDGTFTTEDGTVQSVKMMHNKEWGYLETDAATGFIKPYTDGRYAFAALLPKEGVTLAECTASLTGEELTGLLTNPSREPVNTGLPQFESEFSADLSEALKAMGMELAFGGGDFSGIGTSTEGPLIISRVLHKTFIAVDEKGTRAGASTVVEMVPESAPMVDPKTVILDRPFLYFIFDTATGLPAFMGAVTDLG